MPAEGSGAFSLRALPPEERYETRRALGEGGMGEVRLCRDHLIGREVALKTVLGEHARREDIRARFVHEARVQGQLEHPAIVPVYDLGVDGSGNAFFTMRRVHGMTLEEVIAALRTGDPADQREYSRHRLLADFVRVCLAVHYAHERGVLHRDLKPANVMLGRFGEVYVLDWGLAKASGSGLTPPPSERAPSGREPVEGDTSGIATHQGTVIGTPAYMSPEQVQNAGLDARSDVYALGAILFELLTLEPLNGPGNIAALLQRTMKGVDARASVRAPERDVPPELEAICVRATALAPVDRFPDARAMADRIDAYLSGDRDAALRREMAKKHLDDARAAMKTALDGHDPNDAARAEALRAAGRAIALDPQDPEAGRVLVTLLTAPPKKPPREVLERFEEEAASAQHEMLPLGGTVYFGGALSLFLVQILVGVKSWQYVLVPLALWMLTASLAVWGYRTAEPLRSRLLLALMFTSASALAATSLIYGALLVLPILCCANMAGATLTTRPSRRARVRLLSLLALVVPLVATWLGVHPVAHTFDERGITIAATTVAMPRDMTMLAFGATYVLVILVVGKFCAQYRDRLHDAQLRNEVQAWQLRTAIGAKDP